MLSFPLTDFIIIYSIIDKIFLFNSNLALNENIIIFNILN